MNTIPPYISITFIACVITSFGFLYYAIGEASQKRTTSIILTALMAGWILIIGLLTFQGFFLDFDARPPRLMLFLFPTALLPLICLAIKPSRRFIERMPITTLTYIHLIRVPVEMVLWWLFVEGLVAQEMTFDGINYDILSGISAPFAGIFLVGSKRQNRLGAILWNVAALGLLLNVVIRAILKTPYFYDPASGDLANTAVFYFPYVLLPTFVVPAVLFCHIISLYKLIRYSAD